MDLRRERGSSREREREREREGGMERNKVGGWVGSCESVKCGWVWSTEGDHQRKTHLIVHSSMPALSILIIHNTLS